MSGRRSSRGKPDANQGLIVEFARKAGAYVKVVSQHPKMLDLIVYKNGRLSWWEVKLPGHEHELTKAEAEIIAACPGPCFVVTSVEQAQRILETYHI